MVIILFISIFLKKLYAEDHAFLLLSVFDVGFHVSSMVSLGIAILAFICNLVKFNPCSALLPLKFLFLPHIVPILLVSI